MDKFDPVSSVETDKTADDLAGARTGKPRTVRVRLATKGRTEREPRESDLVFDKSC